MKISGFVLFTTASATLLACAEGNGPNRTVSLSFAGRAASITAPAVFAAPAATSTAADALVITKAQVVLRKVELKTSAEDDCEHNPNPSSCAEFEAGPFLFDIPTDTSIKTEVTVQVPNGTYRELEFQIHKVSSNSPDEAAFRTAHPEFVDQSVRVTGTFNGTAFTFESDVTAVQEMALNPALVVTDSVLSTNLTVRINLGDWFRAADGSVIDPATAGKGGANENVVKDNIRRSLRAFEDRNHDGDDDHGEHEAQDSTGDHSGDGEHGGGSGGHGGDHS
jgi:hypothetical protein